ncbi:hypothetical protein J1N35_009107 [Gossypium stocksii]|uniref:Protein SIEVE ELEMENT OCCLUSION B-like n=1 Tax=Gossypium stocksii TaxID=47602 RepID=A0A9D3W9H2_9ROSI|nr:hypothetical protein J1N35_009107 [Gossypium stocksii]
MFDDAKNKQILSTHVPEDRVVNVKSFLRVIGNVLRHIIPNINIDMKGGSGHIDAFDDQTNLSADDGALDALQKICCELPSKYVPITEPPLSAAKAHIHTATYWIISSVVVCARQITGVVGMRHESTKLTSEALELSYLAHKISCIHEYLHSQLRLCEELKKDKKLMEAFEDFKRTVDTPQVDNLKILRDIFCKEQNLLNPDKTEVYINVLRRKYVLLLISNLDISQEEIRVLELVYKERVSSGHNYEILWLPIVDRIPRNDDYLRKFSDQKLIMPWYTLTHQFSIKPAVIKYIREVWGFVKKPIAVTLNPQGKVLCTNALNMMWIWRNSAFPFSIGKEEGLWKDKPSTLELLVRRLEPNLPTWVSQEKVVCFYGGVKMEWIESFTTKTKEVAEALDTGLEMVYVGKKNARELNMWDTKAQQRKTNATDGIMQELKTFLGFDDSKNGWAMFYNGSGEMMKANGQKVLKSMKSSDQWEKSAKQTGFIPALRKHLEENPGDNHCTRLILPGNDDRIPEKVQCAECSRPMELHFLYRCCVK